MVASRIYHSYMAPKWKIFLLQLQSYQLSLSFEEKRFYTDVHYVLYFGCDRSFAKKLSVREKTFSWTVVSYSDTV